MENHTTLELRNGYEVLTSLNDQDDTEEMADKNQQEPNKEKQTPIQDQGLQAN